MNNDSEKALIELAAYKIKDTLLNLINDLSDNPQPEGYIMPESFHEIFRDICGAYTQLKDVLEMDERTEFMKMLDSLEEKTKKAAVDLNRYVFMNDFAGGRILDGYKLREIKDSDNGIPLNNRGVAADAEHFMTHLEDGIEGSFTLGTLIGAVPLRMTRERYTDYVKRGLAIMTEDMPKPFAAACIERLKDMFYPCLDDSFKTDFPYMYEKLDIAVSTLGDMSKEDMLEALEDMDENAQAIQTVFEIIRIYYNDVNYLRIIATFGVDTEFVFEDDMMLKDLYYALRNAIINKDDSLTEEIKERAVDEIEKRYEITHPLEEELMSEFKEKDEDEISALPNNIQFPLNVNALISEMYYKELDDALMKIDTDMDTDSLIEDFAEYIDRRASEIPRDIRKYAKQKFLDHIPCPMSHDEAAKYINYALDGINDRYLSLMTYGELFSLTEHSHDGHSHEEHSHEGHSHEGHSHDDHCGCGHCH